MRDENQMTKMTDASSRTSERAICQSGGNCEAMRRNIAIGAQGGKSDTTTDQKELGLLMMKVIMLKLSQTGTAASGAYCCSSCSLSQVAARPAKSVL